MRDAKGRWPKGTSGNPGGQPKTRPAYLDALKEALTPAKWKEIVDRAIADAIDGDRHARSWLSDYALGKPVQPVMTLPREELSDELQRSLDRVYGEDGPEDGLPPEPD